MDRGDEPPGSLECVDFIPEFLRAAFAEVGAAGGGEFGRFLRADVFCDADERDLVGPSPGRFGGGGDSFTNAPEVFGDCHTTILRRLDLDPLLVFARFEETAGGKFAGDVLAHERAIADWAERAVIEPLVVAALGAVADGQVVR